jgi:prevent-host-death family protein
MGLQFNIGEAKDRLSELVAAAKRGEEVIIARAGEPEVRMVAINPDSAKLELAAKRRAFIGSCPDIPDVDWFAPLPDDELAQFYGGSVPGDDELPSRHT